MSYSDVDAVVDYFCSIAENHAQNRGQKTVKNRGLSLIFLEPHIACLSNRRSIARIPLRLTVEAVEKLKFRITGP